HHGSRRPDTPDHLRRSNLSAWLATPSIASSLAPCKLLSRVVRDVGRGGFACCCIGQSHADGAHDPTLAAHDFHTASDLVGRANNRDGTDTMVTPSGSWQTARAPHVLLAHRSHGVSCMARAGYIPAWHAFAGVAFHRARDLLHRWPPLLVACHSAL